MRVRVKAKVLAGQQLFFCPSQLHWTVVVKKVNLSFCLFWGRVDVGDLLDNQPWRDFLHF
jgi:hypothetical protein